MKLLLFFDDSAGNRILTNRRVKSPHARCRARSACSITSPINESSSTSMECCAHAFADSLSDDRAESVRT
eukprot:SAG31_NODE_43881_length_265_cov_0.626506_1_plen_69_part_01